MAAKIQVILKIKGVSLFSAHLPYSSGKQEGTKVSV